MSEQKTYQITMTDEHRKALIQALTIVGRAGMGQFRELADLFTPSEGVTMCEHGERFEYAAKAILIPKLPGSASYGIRNEKTPMTSKLAWELLEAVSTPKYRCEGLSGLPLPSCMEVEQ